MDCLTVSAACAVPRRTAELNGLEIGAVDVEQGQRRVPIGPAVSVARIVPTDARADVRRVAGGSDTTALRRLAGFCKPRLCNTYSL